MPSVQEKNFAAPPPHVWLRGRDGERGRGNNEAGEKWKTDVIIIEKKYFTSTDGERDEEAERCRLCLLAAEIVVAGNERQGGIFSPSVSSKLCFSLSLPLSALLSSSFSRVSSHLIPLPLPPFVVSLSTGENDP